ncbi:MAG: tRNA(Met) cytidine acetyltransferase [Gammaproteobacteria bacterium]|nr:tRNA(Met) cytidine acetyltransferase [Gammaproteobacteria bacterium]
MTAATFVDFLTRVRAGLRACRHRRLVLCVGDGSWRAEIDAGFVMTEARLWRLGEGLPGGMSPRQAAQRLGQECDILLVDALTGLDPDALGALGGCVVAGGVIVLLTPPWQEWAANVNPMNAHLAVAGWPENAIGDRFNTRMRRLLDEHPEVIRVIQEAPLPDLEGSDWVTGERGVGERNQLEGRALTRDQESAIEAVCHVVRGQRRRPVVLTADRGRGKSAALGLAAARLFAEGCQRIRVTAPSKEAVATVFAHAGAIPEGAELCFETPEALIDAPPPLDLLLVDEAAGIPTGQLKALLRQYPRLAFATTVHGYEGTGRGFDLRFRAYLDKHTRGWRALRMQEPVRWGDHDPLEALLFRLLLLDAEPVSADRVADADLGNTSFQFLDRQRLIDDEAQLRDVFGLLVGAHYRTRPRDLRHLLDAPNVELFAMQHCGAVVAIALVSLEGGFEDGLVAEIVAGRRRPHGHLLAEAIATHCGFAEGAALRGARVQRIAVHPAVRQRGLGTALLTGIGENLQTRGVEYLGASFGATPELLDFWFRNGFRPLRLGYRHNAASGEPSALVLAGLSQRGRDLACEAGDRFRGRFIRQLSDVHSQLDAHLAARLLAAQGGGRMDALGSRDWADIEAFANGKRAYEEAIVPVTDLVLGALTANRPVSMSQEARLLMIRRVLQNRGWEQVAQNQRLPGRRGVEDAMREVVTQMIVRLKP